ncbi:MAG: Flp pilus assembly protein CpaB [Deltaproteobacteria bacterium]|nr:Flp pilus assembly protein CpaB [Deltaproteobacteria bacterium]
MKNSKAVIISGLLAAVSVGLLYLWVQQKTGPSLGETAEVYVMAGDVGELVSIDETMVRKVALPKKYIQPGALDNLNVIIGSIARAPIQKGEQVLFTKLYLKGQQNINLSRRVSKNSRAITIPVSDVHGVAKLIQPGDRVDVVVSVDYGEGDREVREVKTAMQDVLVLATGQYIDSNIPLERHVDEVTGAIKRQDLRQERYRSVTLEANPEQVQKLVFMMTAGEGLIFLSLRNPLDRDFTSMGTADHDTVLGPTSKRGSRIRMQRRPLWQEF